MKKETKESLKKLLISALIIGTVLTVIYFLLRHFGLTDISRDELQAYIESSGAIAPLVFILASFLQVTFIPINSTITVLAGSYIFGPWLSFLYSFIGMIPGVIVAFFLGRVFGRPFINWIAGSPEIVDEWIGKLNGKENTYLFLAFLLPMFPDDLLCSVAGILPIKFSAFLLMQIITRITTLIYTLTLGEWALSILESLI